MNNGHQGTETVINELRRKYWIRQFRIKVQKAIRTCFYCERRKATGAEPIMGLLPQERLLKYEKTFGASGLDFFGAITVKIRRRVGKLWCPVHLFDD